MSLLRLPTLLYLDNGASCSSTSSGSTQLTLFILQFSPLYPVSSAVDPMEKN